MLVFAVSVSGMGLEPYVLVPDAVLRSSTELQLTDHTSLELTDARDFHLSYWQAEEGSEVFADPATLRMSYWAARALRCATERHSGSNMADALCGSLPQSTSALLLHSPPRLSTSNTSVVLSSSVPRSKGLFNGRGRSDPAPALPVRHSSSRGSVVIVPKSAAPPSREDESDDEGGAHELGEDEKAVAWQVDEALAKDALASGEKSSILVSPNAANAAHAGRLGAGVAGTAAPQLADADAAIRGEAANQPSGIDEQLSPAVPPAPPPPVPPQIELDTLAERALDPQGFVGFTRRVTLAGLCVPATRAWTRICAVAHENHESYASRHGYGLRVFNKLLAPGRPASWSKLPALLSIIRSQGVENAFWMDADSIFMNLSLPLDFLLPTRGKQLSFSRDPNCFINGGHLAIRAGEWGENFLHSTWDVYPEPYPHVWWEQSSIAFVLSGRKSECRHAVWRETCYGGRLDECPCCSTMHAAHSDVVDVRDQHEMNAWLSSFNAGDFILHFAGMPEWEKMQLMLAYSQLASSERADLDILAGFHGKVTNLAAEPVPSGRSNITI